jgi:hypothetical protein
MYMNEIIKVLRQHRASIRIIAKATGIPKSSIHRYLTTQCQGLTYHSGTQPLERAGFLLIRFPCTYFCPWCKREQNHAWLCLDCGEFILAECGEEYPCCPGLSIHDFSWGRRV